MAGDPAKYTYPWPLDGWDNFENLSDKQLPDKSMLNVQTGVESESYQTFVKPLDKSRRGGFDVHVYYFQHDEKELKFAHALWKRIRLEFPELQCYKFWDKPVGPHTMAMFEIDLHSPAQFGAFVPWLAINRGPLSVLIHPNTVDELGNEIEEERNHTQRAIWMGERLTLRTGTFAKSSKD